MIDKEFWKNKKVLVTGHTGFKGSWLCEVLLYLGVDVTGYALEPKGGNNLFDLLDLEQRINSCIADVRDAKHLCEVFRINKPEIVFHMAAQPLVRESYENPIDTYETNVMGTVNLLEAVRKTSSVRSVVNVTTDKVYKNLEREEGYKEEEELCGFDPYSNSKSCSELVTYSYKASFFSEIGGPSISTARAGNVIGGGDFAKDRIIPDCVRAVMEERPIQVRNPYSVRPYQHVLDCLMGYMTLAEKQYDNKEKYTGCYNFGPKDSDCVTTGTLVNLFVKQWNKMEDRGGASSYYEATWENASENGPHEANFLKLNAEKANNVLQWMPVWGIEVAVQKTVEWAHGCIKNADASIITKIQIQEYLQNE